MATIPDGKGTFMLAAHDESFKLSKVEIGRPEPGPDDVAIDLKYCGMCHSDLHTVNGEWGVGKYPIAVGHELGGIVRAVGANCTKLKVGDKVAVGCMVESCKNCELCSAGTEQHCLGMCQTYSSAYPKGCGHDECAGHHTNGGYSTGITVHQRFAFTVPEGMELPVAGVLCCAGITMYSPLARHVLGKQNMNVGIVGFGGLGMMGVKIAKAMGASVTVFSRSDAKKAEAEKMGAEILAYTDEEQIKKKFRAFDVILDTVAQVHEINGIISTLKPYTGILTLIGGVPQPYQLAGFPMIFNGTRVEGSLIGGAALTQEMLDFCGKHGIKPETKIIHAKEAEEALKALNAGTAGVIRHVIDTETIKEL
eukprot:TRINITY_DN18979_c0_g1_i2.p1 TRINITY_DN18979_c0_g1~~TRINITY_DN18979_c0_g1_i2.p1  ORF type:complete len:365 (-),score=91.44 TRINITY_DN18979_c0_g1_i2:243-1337(-)